MSQAPINPSQLSSNQSRQGSEMMKFYLVTKPSTTTERLVQGKIMSNQEIEDSVKQKESQLDAMVRRAMGGSSQRT
ncbi:uncharacterized protein GGS22DRAFT_191225 [Annulohypoxylon maeteangense]|uniref:uncharacterized protein n=1 Tax=Annulohypoxylon maeteangense TaxID=1927788 RepID=UPI0020085675|nr:uncharacterized protein GGS22DRAFT_191225 [Annulohypoxylon maeteangense]KAI0882635.1 hypothetical protein GGS22DRAFT_191225 [Annulohypoxylon maeteangense]